MEREEGRNEKAKEVSLWEMQDFGLTGKAVSITMAGGSPYRGNTALNSTLNWR